MSEEKQTVAGAYAKLEGHERECALRYDALGKGIQGLIDEQASIKSGIRAGLFMLATIALGVIGWLGIQVYELNRAELDRASERPAAASTARPTGTAELTPTRL